MPAGMNIPNPYSSLPPSNGPPNTSLEFPLEFATPLLLVMVYSVFGVLFVVVATYCTFAVIVTVVSPTIPISHFTVLIAVIGSFSAFGVYGCGSAIRATVIIDENGIRMMQLFSREYAWDSIATWRQSNIHGVVSFTVNSTDFLCVANAATNRNRNKVIGDVFRHKLGEPDDSVKFG